MRYVTIATDVSSDPRYKITTWACYIRHDGGAIKRVGRFKNYSKNTALAETHALINALVIARKEVPNWESSKVIIYNEIEHVLEPCTTKAGNIRKRDEERANQIKTIAIPILQQAVDYERRKIKAHFKDWKHSDNPRKYAINRWCDIESRAEMKRIRSEEKKRKRLR